MTAKPLVALGIRLLEPVVGRRAGAAQHDEPVLEQAALREGPVSVLFEELVGVEVLACCLPPGHEEDVIPHQRGRIDEGNDTIDEHGKGDAEVADRLRKRDPLEVLVDEKLGERRPREVKTEERGAADKSKEIAVVATTHTVVEPDAVVVLGLDAVVAQAAVVGAGRPPDAACLAVLGGHLHRGGFRVGRLDKCPFRRWLTKPERILVLVHRRGTVDISRQYLGQNISA